MNIRNILYVATICEIVALYTWAILSWVKTEVEWDRFDAVRRVILFIQNVTERVTKPVRWPFSFLPLTVRVETRMERTENLMESAKKRYRVRFSHEQANDPEDPATAEEALEGRYMAFDLRPALAILALGLLAMWLAH